MKKDKKYCIFCGTENDIHNEKCCNKKCKKKFVKDYYDLLYLVVDYYKGDFDGKFFDLLKAILVYLLNTWTYGIVVVFSIVAAATGVIAAINDDLEDASLTNELPRTFIKSDLKQNDQNTIDRLYSIIKSNNMNHIDYDYNNAVFVGKNVKINDLDNKAKLLLAYNAYFEDKWLVNYSYTSVVDCSSLSYSNKASKICEKYFQEIDDNVPVEYRKFGFSVFDLKLDEFNEYYKNLFGTNIEKYEDFASGNYYCEWEGSNYFCFQDYYAIYSIVDSTEFEQVGARTYDDRIEIDLAVRYCVDIEKGIYDCYESAKKEYKIFSTCDPNGDGNCNDVYFTSDVRGLLYTATFIKDEDGNYEWYDVETKGEYYKEVSNEG